MASSVARVLVLAGALMLAAAGARGQLLGGVTQAPEYSRGYNVAVRERPHPDWAPVDLDLGGFTLQPALALTGVYESNEKDAQTGARPDVSVRISPSLQLDSDWGRDSLGLSASLTRTQYLRSSEDDATEYGLAGTGRLDLAGDGGVTLRVSDQHLVLSQADPDVPVDSLGPEMFDRQDVQVTATRTLPQLQLQGAFAARNEDYGSVGAPGGGTYDFSGRDGTYLSGRGRVSYALSPAAALFAGALYDRSYRPLYAGLAQDADGFELNGGVNFDLSHLARGEISAGYLRQAYSTPATPADSGFAFGANLQYFPTELTTVSLAGERNAAPASVAGSPGGVDLDGSIRVDHELLRNLVLSAGLQGGQVRYRSYLVRDAYSNRVDSSFGARLGATYAMNRLVAWELNYGFDDDHSTDALRRSYGNGQLSLTLRLTR